MRDGGRRTARLRPCAKPKWPRGIMSISAELTRATLAGAHVPTELSGVYAHSLPDRSIGDWELLLDHAAAVGERAACFAEPFGWAEAARIAGRLHGIGKLTADFQAYIRGERSSGGDHSTAGPSGRGPASEAARPDACLHHRGPSRWVGGRPRFRGSSGARAQAAHRLGGGRGPITSPRCASTAAPHPRL